MMQHLLLLLSLLIAGCCHERGNGTLTPGADVLRIGQSWEAATEMARTPGYELHDAAQLQLQPQPDGFYIELPGDRALIVVRDTKTNTVGWLEPFKHWSKGKWSESEPPVRTFVLPPAASAP